MAALDARNKLDKQFTEIMPVMGAARQAAAYAGEEFTGMNIGQAASKFTTTMKTILKDIGTVYNDDRNIIFSAIYTIMDAVNNSVMGGLAGLESELEKIVNEENANNSGEPNAALEFLGDCANFIRFSLEYLYINKNLKIKKHLIKKIAEAHAELGAAGAAEKKAAKKKLDKLLELQKEASGKASIRDVTEQNDDLTKHNKRIEYLNNAFKHLVFTYGQLSGRTIYNIIKFLQQGGPPEVGWFDPTSFGSLGSSMIRSTPPGAIAGQVMDSVVDFFKALAGASEASYKSLKKERELANEYMAYITDDTKNQVGGTTAPIKIEEETFVQYYDLVKAKKKDKKGKDKNYKKRIQKLTGNKGRTNTNQNISDLTTGNIEKRIKDVRNAMLELNHVDNLKTLLKYIVDYNSIIALTKSANIYVKGSSILNTKDDSKIKLLTKDEVSEMHNNPKVKKIFKKLIKNFDITNVSPDKDKLGELTIEKSNPQLYGIVMNFIRNNYKSAEDQVEELEKRIKKLETSSESTNKLYTFESEKEKEKDKEKIPKLQALLELLKVLAEKEKVSVVHEAILAVVKEVDAVPAEGQTSNATQVEKFLKRLRDAFKYVYNKKKTKQQKSVKKFVNVEKKKQTAIDEDANRSSSNMADEKLNKAVKTLMEAVDALKEIQEQPGAIKEAISQANKIIEVQTIPTLDDAKNNAVTAKQELEEAKKAAMDEAGNKRIDYDINNKLLELLALMELDADVIPNFRKKRGFFGQLFLGDKQAKEEDVNSDFRMQNDKIIDGENTDNEDAKDEQKLANITREIAKLTKIVVAENERIKGLGGKMKGTSSFTGKKKPKEGKEFLEEEYNSLLDQLNKIKIQELGDLNKDIHNSGDYGKLAAIFVKLKREMKAEIQRLVTDLKPEDISIKGQEKLEIVKSGLKKMLEFIRYREFGSINALFKRERNNKTRRGGGDLSNIRRHIAKATRRIETTLNNFNNTRRNKRIKPRKTRRVNYSH